MSLPARRLPEVPEWLDGAAARSARAREAAELPSDARIAERTEGTSGERPAAATRRRRRHHLGFAIAATLLVAPMVLGIVSMNALLAQTSFRIDAAERRLEELSQEHLSLLHEQARLSAPGRIAAWARRNGMRLPDDIRSLHASGGSSTAPAGADTKSSDGGG